MVVVVVLVYLSIYPSIYLSIYLFVCLSVCLPESLKTQQFCETSPIFELDNVKNPCRTLSLQAIDASIRWWHGRPAPRAPLVRTYTSLSNSSSANGILMSWLIKSHAILRHSRLSSSNTPRCWTNFATINRVAKTGPNTKRQPSTLTFHIGSCRDHSLRAFSLRNLPS